MQNTIMKTIKFPFLTSYLRLTSINNKTVDKLDRVNKVNPI